MLQPIINFLIFVLIWVTSITLIEYSGDDIMLDIAGDFAGGIILILYSRMTVLISDKSDHYE